MMDQCTARAAASSRLDGQAAKLTHTPDKRVEDLELQALRAGISDIGGLIARTRIEVAGLTPAGPGDVSRLGAASCELDAVVDTTEQAAVQIMVAAEKIQDAEARMRQASGLPAAVAGELDGLANASTDIVMACAFQDLTGQRIRKVVAALTYVEARVKSLAELWDCADAAAPPPEQADMRPDAHLMHGPSSDGLEQDNIDELLGMSMVASQDDIDNLFN